MNTPSSTVTIWESGRLVAPLARRGAFEFSHEHWIAAALLVLCALVMTLFVGVLEREVDRGEMQRAQRHSRAVAEAECEAAQAADSRSTCLAIFNGDVVASARPVAVAAPSDEARDMPDRLPTAALPLIAGVQQ